jgi:hypothetical protein
MKERKMKIGILGSGIVGRVLGAGFVKHGHDVVLGTRDPKKKDVTDWVGANTGARSGTLEEAAQLGEVLVLAVLGRAIENIIELAGPANFASKTVIDVNNPIADKPPVNGVLEYTTGPNDSLGEWIQTKLPDAHVVKAFNSVGNGLMVNPHFAQGTPTMFICGDSEEAKARYPPLSASSDGNLTIAAVSYPLARWNRYACCGACRASHETNGTMRSRC